MARIQTIVLVHLSNLNFAIMVVVHSGPIGPAGMIAVQNAMVEPNQELVNVKKGMKLIVQDHQLKSNNVTENPVILMGCSIGKITLDILVGHGLTQIVLPKVKQYTIDVFHIACRWMAALLPCLIVMLTLSLTLFI